MLAALDLVGRPRPLISGLDSRAGARTRRRRARLSTSSLRNPPGTRCSPPPDRACAAEPSPGRSMRGDESRQISFFAALLAAGVTQSVSQSAWARDALACGDVGIDPGGRRLQSVWSRSTPCRMRRSCPKADGGEGRRPKQGRCWADRDRRMPAQYPRESMMEGST